MLHDINRCVWCPTAVNVSCRLDCDARATVKAVLDAAHELAERAKYLGTRMQALRETMAELERGTRVERRSGYGRRPYDSIYKGEVERSSNHIVADEGKYGRRHRP